MPKINPFRSIKFLIAAIVTLVLLSGLLVFILIKSATRDATSSGTLVNLLNRFAPKTAVTIGTEDENESDLTLLSARSAVSLTRGMRSGVALFYARETKQIVESNLDGSNEHALIPDELPNLVKITWSPDRQSAIGLFSSSGSAVFRYFKLTTPLRFVDLPSETRTVAFSPDGRQIAFFTYNSGVGSVFISQPNGTIAKKIFSSRTPDVQLYWPSVDSLYLAAKEQNFGLWDLFRISMLGELTQILKSESSLSLNWSPSGKHVLYSSLDADALPKLRVFNIENHTTIELDIKTLASYCAWSVDEKSIFCGASPGDLELNPAYANAIVPHDIYSIPTSSGPARSIFNRTQDQPMLNIQEPFLSTLEDRLVFVNGFNGRVYSLKLQTTVR